MGRFYMAEISIASATTQVDILEVSTGTGHPVKIHEVLITTDIEQDANEAQIELELSRFTGAWTVGSTGAGRLTPSAYALDETGAADSTSVVTGSATQATGGTKQVLGSIWVNNRAGLHFLRPPESAILLGHDGTNDSGFVVAMTAAAPTATAWGGYVVFEETG